jgi:hypothetical protein
MTPDAVPSSPSDPTADFTPAVGEPDEVVLDQWPHRWQVEAAQGRQVTFADLRRDRPDLAARLQQRIVAGAGSCFLIHPSWNAWTPAH